MALRSYPSPKVMGSDGECQAATAQERQQRGASPHPKSGAAAERNYPTPEVRGPAIEEPPHIQGTGGAAWKQMELLHGSKWSERSYSTFKVRRGVREKIPLLQGKRIPSKMVGVARGHQRADTLNP